MVATVFRARRGVLYQNNLAVGNQEKRSVLWRDVLCGQLLKLSQILKGTEPIKKQKTKKPFKQKISQER
jgi:hypothetical protein